MPLRFAEPGDETYKFPLTIRHLLDGVLARSAAQRLHYRDSVSISYAGLKQRIGRLANLLSVIGVEAGTTVAVMDWDSHRYLEAFFAIPMMGAVLQTVNVRLSPSQVLHTMQDSVAQAMIVHRDFFQC